MFRTLLPTVLAVACSCSGSRGPEVVPAGAAAAVPSPPRPGDEALCALLGGADEAARADAAAKLAPRFAARPDNPVDAARSWCLGAWERPYVHDCGETGRACDTDECVAWQHAHGLPEEDALNACMQDCNCGE
jgi:hypothetical protein